MKLTKFVISENKQIYVKTLTVFERTFKMKVMSAWTFFELWLTSAVISTQRLLHKNEIAQYIQNFKCQDINQRHFRKP